MTERIRNRGKALTGRPRFLAMLTALAMMVTCAVPSLLPFEAYADDNRDDGAICIPQNKPLGDNTTQSSTDDSVATWVGQDMYIGSPSTNGGATAAYGLNGQTPGVSYAVEAEGLTVVGGRLAINSIKNSWGANYGADGKSYSGRGFRFGIVGFGGQVRPDSGDALVVAGSNSQMSSMTDRDKKAVNVLGWNDAAPFGRGRGWLGSLQKGEPTYTARIAGNQSAAMGLEGKKEGVAYPGPSTSWMSVYNWNNGGGVEYNADNPLESVNINGKTTNLTNFGTDTVTAQSNELYVMEPTGNVTDSTNYQPGYKRTKYNSGKEGEEGWNNGTQILNRTIIEATFNVNERVLRFTGDGESKLQVFNINASDLNNGKYTGTSFAFEKIPDGASVVINVEGETVDFYNGWRFWWAGAKELGADWSKYEIGNGYANEDNTTKYQRTAYVTASKAIMWNFNEATSVTIRGGQATDARVTAKKQYKWNNDNGSWYDSDANYPERNYSGTANVSDDPAAAMLGSITVPNGTFDDHVTTNGRVWVGGNFYMNNPDKAYTFGEGVGEGDSSSIIDMDQERHNLQWAATVKTNCPTIGWQKVDESGKPITVDANGTKASFQIFGSLDAAQAGTSPLMTVTDNQLTVDQDSTEGVIKIQNLKKNATYYIKEVSAPTGYQRSANIYRIVTANDDTTHKTTIDKVYDSSGKEITTAADKNLFGTSGIVNKPNGGEVEWGKQVAGDTTHQGLPGSQWELTRIDPEPKTSWTIKDVTEQVEGVTITQGEGENEVDAPDSIELETGQHAKFGAKVLPADKVPQDVTWESSNPSLVTVTDGEAVVLRDANTGESSEVTITATSVADNTQKDTIVIVCKPSTGNVTSVTIMKGEVDAGNTLTLTVGGSQQLTAQTDPANAAVTWSTDKASVASVDASGNVTAVGAGTATITAAATSHPEVKDTITVYVTEAVQRTTTDIYVKWTDHNQAYIHYWNDSGTTDNGFPGTSMTKVTCGGEQWYTYSVPLTGRFNIQVSDNGTKYQANVDGNEHATEIPIAGTAESYYIDGWYAEVKEGTPPAGCSTTRTAAPLRAQRAEASVQLASETDEEAAGQDGEEGEGDKEGDGEQADPNAPHDVNLAVGRFKLTNLPDGTYTLKEKVAPAGYYLNPNLYRFVLANGKVTWSVQKVDKDGKEIWQTLSPDKDGVLWISDVPTEFDWDKLDMGYADESLSDGVSLAGSKWKLEVFQEGEKDEETGEVADGQWVDKYGKDAITDCVVEDPKEGEGDADEPKECPEGSLDRDPEQGSFALKGLDRGKYRLKETTAPDGWTVSDAYYYFELDAMDPDDVQAILWTGGTATSYDAKTGRYQKDADPEDQPEDGSEGTPAAQSGTDSANEAPNYRKKGVVEWTKIEEGDATNVLAGSKWKLEFQADGEVDYVTLYGDDGIVDCAPEDASQGCADDSADRNPAAGHFKLENLKWGNYRLTETTAPEGYGLPESTVYTFTIDKDHLTGIVISVKVGDDDPKQLEGNLIPNTPDGFVLPATGGTGANMAIVYAGLAVLAVAMMGAALTLRRQQD